MRLDCSTDIRLSLPSRERGLKQTATLTERGEDLVAPFTGAWIETDADRRAALLQIRRSLHGSVD